MALLRVDSISKAFTGTPVLQNVSFQAGEGQIVCVLGPSGCGKTTLLRIIAGLETADSGQVTFDGRPLGGVPVHRRGFGLMFQDYALFPHKDVAANVAFGLRMQGLPPAEVEQRVQEALTLVNLQGLAHRDVNQLSGGEQQRVALARSLAPRPQLLMLDEPIGALDRTLRDRLLEELGRILRQIKATVVYVTHDQAESFAIADRIVLMDEGRIVQVGTPQQVYHRPVNAWAARFLGMQNLLPGEWIAPGLVRTSIGPLPIEGCGRGLVAVLIRPEAASLDQAAGAAAIAAIVTDCSFRGTTVHLVVQHASGEELAFDLPAGPALPATGQTIALFLRRTGIVCLTA